LSSGSRAGDAAIPMTRDPDPMGVRPPIDFTSIKQATAFKSLSP